jgi:hypothetical protein
MKTRRAGSERGARALYAAAPAAAIAAALLAAMALAGCGKGSAKAAEPIYPYVADGPRVFYACASGLADAPPPAAARAEGADGAEKDPPATRAHNASVLSSDGRTIVAAVNGWGIARVEREGTAAAAEGRAAAGGAATAGGGPEGSAASGAPRYRIDGRPLPGLFESLTTGGAWPVSGGFLVQLFRDPFTEATTTSGAAGVPQSGPRSEPRSGGLVFLTSAGEALTPDPFAEACKGGYELFALLPSEKGWFAELRKESASRVELKFLAIGDPLAGAGANGKTGAPAAGSSNGDAAAAAAATEVGRSRFEEALKPRAMSSLGSGEARLLATALRALGDGPWLVRLRSAEGRDSWLLSGGAAEEASAAYAWSGPEGMLVLRSDGWIALAAEASATKIASLGEPVPGAAFTAVAAARGLVAAAWETGEFPGLSAAGLVIAPLPR